MIRTLIVDDDSLIHVTLRSLIVWESCGYTVVQDCSGGNQALSCLMEHPVDLLITDIKMPGMDGLELMRQLRQSGSMPVTVVLSGYNEFELVREAFRLGAYDYLLKSNISRASLTRLLDGLREKVFPAAAGLSAGAPQPGRPELENGDYVLALFTVEDFTQTAQRFGDNLRERMEKPMLELVRQVRRLQGRVTVRARPPLLLRAVLLGSEPERGAGHGALRRPADPGAVARLYESGHGGRHQRRSVPAGAGGGRRLLRDLVQAVCPPGAGECVHPGAVR